MLFKVYNRALIEDRESASLAASVAADGTTLTVDAIDNNVWADNDYLILGEIGSPTAEVLQVNGAVSDGTSLIVDRLGSGGCRFAHSVGEPVYRVDFNQVEFSRNTTDSTSGVSVITTSELYPEHEFTFYEDTSNTTGYGFARFKNSTTSTYSSYSDGVNYEALGEGSSYDPRTLWRLRKRVRVLLDEERAGSKLTDDMIRDAVNDKQRDIAHQRLWSFYETEKSFSSVSNQLSHSIPTTVQKLYNVTFDTQPLKAINYDEWKQLHWNTNSSTTTPSRFTIWNRNLMVWPRPSSSAGATTLGADISTAVATTVTVVSTSPFKRGDYYRFIVDSEVIYATAITSTTFTGCLRGQEGTTATTHTNGSTVTERDIVYTAHVEPTDLFDTQDRTSIPEVDVLAYGAAIDLAPLLEKSPLVLTFEAKYQSKLKELEAKYAMKQTAQFGRVRSSDERLVDSMFSVNPNLYPSNITGS